MSTIQTQTQTQTLATSLFLQIRDAAISNGSDSFSVFITTGAGPAKVVADHRCWPFLTHLDDGAEMDYAFSIESSDEPAEIQERLLAYLSKKVAGGVIFDEQVRILNYS